MQLPFSFGQHDISGAYKACCSSIQRCSDRHKHLAPANSCWISPSYFCVLIQLFVLLLFPLSFLVPYLAFTGAGAYSLTMKFNSSCWGQCLLSHLLSRLHSHPCSSPSGGMLKTAFYWEIHLMELFEGFFLLFSFSPQIHKQWCKSPATLLGPPVRQGLRQLRACSQRGLPVLPYCSKNRRYCQTNSSPVFLPSSLPLHTSWFGLVYKMREWN